MAGGKEVVEGCNSFNDVVAGKVAWKLTHFSEW